MSFFSVYRVFIYFNWCRFLFVLLPLLLPSFFLSSISPPILLLPLSYLLLPFVSFIRYLFCFILWLLSPSPVILCFSHLPPLPSFPVFPPLSLRSVVSYDYKMCIHVPSSSQRQGLFSGSEQSRGWFYWLCFWYFCLGSAGMIIYCHLLSPVSSSFSSTVRSTVRMLPTPHS